MPSRRLAWSGEPAGKALCRRSFRPAGEGGRQITSLEARRLGQKVMEVIYTKDCGLRAAYRHVAESETSETDSSRPRERPSKAALFCRHREAPRAGASERDRPSIFGVRFWTILCLRLGSMEISQEREAALA